MTIKKAKIVAVIASIIIGVLTWIPVVHMRMEYMGGLYLNKTMVCLTIFWIGGIALGMYFFLGSIWIQYLVYKERKNDFITKLRDSSNGEKKILQKYICNNTESHILSKVVKAYNPIYSAKIKEDDKVELIVRDRKSNEMICSPINVDDIDYLISHFEFSEEPQDYEEQN